MLATENLAYYSLTTKKNIMHTEKSCHKFAIGALPGATCSTYITVQLKLDG